MRPLRFRIVKGIAQHILACVAAPSRTESGCRAAHKIRDREKAATL